MATGRNLDRCATLYFAISLSGGCIFYREFRADSEHTLVTLSEIMFGLAIGITLGIITALQFEMSPAAKFFLKPLLVFSQAIPVFALAPVLTLWLGYGMISKVTMAVLIIYFPVTSALHDGLTRTPSGLSDLAHVMNAKPFTAFISHKTSGCCAKSSFRHQAGHGICSDRGSNWRMGRLIRGVRISHVTGKWARKNRFDVRCTVHVGVPVNEPIWTCHCSDKTHL